VFGDSVITDLKYSL